MYNCPDVERQPKLAKKKKGDSRVVRLLHAWKEMWTIYTFSSRSPSNFWFSWSSFPLREWKWSEPMWKLRLGMKTRTRLHLRTLKAFLFLPVQWTDINCLWMLPVLFTFWISCPEGLSSSVWHLQQEYSHCGSLPTKWATVMSHNEGVSAEEYY